MVQNSPRNLEFKQRGVNFEIAFFYLNVGSEYQPHVVRVDVPVWVARDHRAVNELHGLLLAQCRMQGRNPYPYVLTRAHELAVVSRATSANWRNSSRRSSGHRPIFRSIDFSARRSKFSRAKIAGKDLARSE